MFITFSMTIFFKYIFSDFDLLVGAYKITIENNVEKQKPTIKKINGKKLKKYKNKNLSFIK